MAKKKVVKKAVSRRTVKSKGETVTAKKTVKKKKVPSVKSAEVKHTLALIHSFSASEMEYYQQIREIVNADQSETISRQHQIGTLLLECQRKHPKSNAASNIVLAVGITPSTGRYYRKFAERVKPDELELYTTMKNPDLDWKIPFDTLYKIVEKWDTKADRVKVAKAVIAEKMSSNTMLERFPLNDRTGEEPEVLTITIKGGLRKLQDLVDKETKQYDAVIEAFRVFDNPDDLPELTVMASEVLDMHKAVDAKRSMVKALFKSLSDFRETGKSDEVLKCIEDL